MCDYSKVQHEAGIKYKNLAEKEGIRLVHSNWDGKREPSESCICYNLCYSEGTNQEIIHINRRSSGTCICYNTSYNGKENPQCRPVQELDKQRKAELRIIKAAQKMMEKME